MDLKVGIQLYSVRNSMAIDPLATIEKVVQLGYKYLEAANHNAINDQGLGFGVSSDELNKVLSKSGAKVVSAHIFPFMESDYKAVIKYNKEIGNKYIVEPMGFFKNEKDVIEKSAYYNKIGEICAKEGMMFLYHNHFQEFQMFNGKTVIELLAEHTDPAFMGFELDTYWAMRGGQCPVEVIKKLGTRIKLIHQKDFPKDSKSEINILKQFPEDMEFSMESTFMKEGLILPTDFTEIGTGIMDIQSIIDAAASLGSVDYLILEQDRSQLDEMESIKISMEAFKKFKGVDL